MAFFANLRLRVRANIVTRIFRNLSGKGKIYVSVGQEVTPSDIIGTATVSSGFRTLDLPKLLSCKVEDCKKYLKPSIGQRFYKGELLAYKPKGFLEPEKVVVAPTDGILEFFNPKSGEARIALLPKKTDLPAGVYGTIEAVDNPRAQVIIKTQVTRISGIFGTGRMRDGMLQVLTARDKLVVASMINPQLSDRILLGGSLIFKDAISNAISCSVNGIITGGINAKDYKGMAGGRITFPKKLETDIGISVLVTEGFGSIPIGEDIYQTLAYYDGKFVIVDGNKALINLPSFESDSIINVRKVHLPPLEQTPVLKDQDIEVVELKNGMKVRVVGSSFIGEEGTLLNIDQKLTLLASGAKGYLATLETKSRKFKVPVNNLEIL